MTRTRCLPLAILLALGVPMAHADDLMQIYQESRASDPTLAGAEATKLATDENVDQARSQLLPQIAAALEIWEVPPHALTVEVTENAFAEDAPVIADALRTLHEMGVGVAIDDFGTGYSSFSYLKRFPVSELKIDIDFVADIARDPRSARLSASMVELAHALGAVAVAEGVEDEETLERLRELGCDQAQGFLFGRPIPAAEAVAALGVAPVELVPP